jgi:DNA-directed RNA polymerase specialized sigma subunit
MLYEVNENDSIAVEGALFSAVFELSAKASLRLKQDPLSNADLAVAFDLIRVAYNRAQRSMRHDARIRMEATRGETTAGDSNLRPIDVIRENSAIFSAQIRELLDGIYGDLDEREQRVIDSLSQGMTVDEVALCEGVYRTTISRVVKRLSDRIRRCLIDG